jgi:hypothetical protein
VAPQAAGARIAAMRTSAVIAIASMFIELAAAAILVLFSPVLAIFMLLAAITTGIMAALALLARPAEDHERPSSPRDEMPKAEREMRERALRDDSEATQV